MSVPRFFKITFLGLSLGASFAFAATAPSGSRGTSSATETTVGSSNDAVPSPNNSAGGVYLSAGSGLALFNGNTGWSVNVGALTPAYSGSGLYVGADLAVSFFSFNTSTGGAPTASNGATGFQLLPTAIYRFDIAQVRGLKPYVGLSVGPHVYTETINGAGNTSLFFEALFRPGIFTSLSESLALNLEPKLGLLGGKFVFLPSVNVFFVL